MKIDENTVALVTGAGRGLGRHFVTALLARGARKVYVACRNEAQAQAQEWQACSERVVALTLDVTQPNQVATAAQRAGDINLLVNNAGVNTMSGVLAHGAIEAARREMEVNYFGTLRMAQAFAPALSRDGGAIINVLSILARVSLPMMGTLCASKAAALRLTECLDAELCGQGVRVLAVLPGAIDTDMSRDFPGAKLAPAAVAEAALDALSGTGREVYVGEMAQELAQGLAAAREIIQGQMLGIALNQE